MMELARPARPLADADARDRIRNALDETLVVEAAAGTGKTTELVARIVALVRTGRARLRNLVSVTFTEKAAGEMKLRLRAELEKARQAASPGSEESRRFTAAIEDLETSHIGTIHALCADLLRERPVEARVDPFFDVAAGEESDALFDEAFDAWFEENVPAPPEGMRRLLRRRPRHRTAPGPREQLRGAARDLLEHRDFDTAWHRPGFDRDGRMARIVEALDEVGAYAARADRPDDWITKNILEISEWVRELRRREKNRERDHDGLEAELREISRRFKWQWRGGGKWFGKGLEKNEVIEKRDAVKADLDAFVRDSDMDLAALLQQELQPVVKAYEALKARAGRLDFLDLLLRLRNLVRDDRDVRAELQRRFTHLLVDEFQDTDPLQAELLLLLAADTPDESDWLEVRTVPGKLFVVGDPKQSIYRFRRADVALYEAVKQRLVSRGASVVFLTSSFRSDPAVQEAVNASFDHAMRPAPGSSQAQYVPLSPVREPVTDRPAVIALPVPRPFSPWGKVTGQAIDASLPDAVGAFVDWLVNRSGWTISERGRPGETIPLRPGHVCLLFKRFVSFGEDVTRPYVNALEARRVPHVLVGGRSWHAREEVTALRTALAAVEWPDDELSVFAALRGPFFALSDDSLVAFKGTFGALYPLRRGDRDAELTDLTRPVADALAILGRLHWKRNRRPAADTVSRLLDETRAHAGVAIWQAGEQALANLLQLVDAARRFESPGATSFRAFVERLAAEAERGDTGEAPVVEEGADGVRIMTAHRAKGLEFPVVILCDPTAPATPQNPSRWVDPERRIWAMPLAGCVPYELEVHRDEVLRRDAEEAVRLLYVAGTRARDLLVVPAVGEDRFEGWTAPLAPAIYPHPDSRENPASAPGCPSFGTDTIYERSPERPNPVNPVRPGRHVPELGSHRVTWWDPRALQLDVQPDLGIRHQKLLESDQSGGGASVEQGWLDWRAQRQHALDLGSTPSVRLLTATERAAAIAEAEGGDPSVRYEQTDAPRRARPHGKRFGTLVHAVLADVALDAGPQAIAHTARVQARMLGCEDDEVAAAVEAVKSALAHPLLAEAARSSDLRRETPLLVRDADGGLVEAVVDLAWREDAGWVVLDFKTDGETSQRRPQYERQVRLYADGITAATGLPARPVLLSV